MEKRKKWRVEVYINKELAYFIDVIAETKDEAIKAVEKKIEAQYSFKVKKSYD